MKGVVLAGGRGTRLRPTTQVINKHIIPIYDKPMIFYPVETLYNAGIDEIMIVSSAEHIGKYIQLLETSYPDISFSYKVQSEPNGIADALSLAEGFVDDKFAVILGDNIILEDLSEQIQSFQTADTPAQVFLTTVNEPAAYGVASVQDGRVVTIEEKPSSPDSNFAVIGLYLYTTEVFDHIKRLEPSDRGEYEITDINDQYARDGDLAFAKFEGDWFDAGTPEGIYKASRSVRNEKQT